MWCRVGRPCGSGGVQREVQRRNGRRSGSDTPVHDPSGRGGVREHGFETEFRQTESGRVPSRRRSGRVPSRRSREVQRERYTGRKGHSWTTRRVVDSWRSGTEGPSPVRGGTGIPTGVPSEKVTRTWRTGIRSTAEDATVGAHLGGDGLHVCCV